MSVKNSTKTKVQLVEENDVLKEKIRELLKQKTIEDSNTSGGIARDYIKQNGMFKTVEVEYNIETGQAKVKDIYDTAKNNKDYALAIYQAKIDLVEKVFNK